jgi:hypothetical protein
MLPAIDSEVLLDIGKLVVNGKEIMCGRDAESRCSNSGRCRMEKACEKRWWRLCGMPRCRRSQGLGVADEQRLLLPDPIPKKNGLYNVVY